MAQGNLEDLGIPWDLERDIRPRTHIGWYSTGFRPRARCPQDILEEPLPDPRLIVEITNPVLGITNAIFIGIVTGHHAASPPAPVATCTSFATCTGLHLHQLRHLHRLRHLNQLRHLYQLLHLHRLRHLRQLRHRTGFSTCTGFATFTGPATSSLLHLHRFPRLNRRHRFQCCPRCPLRSMHPCLNRHRHRQVLPKVNAKRTGRQWRRKYLNDPLLLSIIYPVGPGYRTATSSRFSPAQSTHSGPTESVRLDNLETSAGPVDGFNGVSMRAL